MRLTTLLVALLTGALILPVAGSAAPSPKPPAPRRVAPPAVATVPAPYLITRVLVLGDSISEPCVTGAGWCAVLKTSLASVGITADIHAVASGGKRCLWVAGQIDAALATYQPDTVILNCGTNDDPAQTCYGEPCTSWAWRYIVERSRAAGARVGVALVGYTDSDEQRVIRNKPWLERVNDILWPQISTFMVPWQLAVVNLQVVPGDPTHLPDGVHPAGRGDEVYAWLWHDAMASAGWVPPPLTARPCGLHGRRTGAPVPPHTDCTR